MAMRIYLPMHIDADICKYPTYVGYNAIYADNMDIDADIRIRMAIPNPDLYEHCKLSALPSDACVICNLKMDGSLTFELSHNICHILFVIL